MTDPETLLARVAADRRLWKAAYAEGAAAERQRIRDAAIDYWQARGAFREGFIPGWIADLLDGDDDD